MIQNVGNLKTRAIQLQQWIGFQSNMIFKELALMDVKLKEKKVLEEEVVNVINHPGDINSRTGSSAIFRNRLDEIINEAAVIQSNMDLSWELACVDLGLHRDLLSRINAHQMDARSVAHPELKDQYYPTDYKISSNIKEEEAPREIELFGNTPGGHVRNKHHKKKGKAKKVEEPSSEEVRIPEEVVREGGVSDLSEPTAAQGAPDRVDPIRDNSASVNNDASHPMLDKERKVKTEQVKTKHRRHLKKKRRKHL